MPRMLTNKLKMQAKIIRVYTIIGIKQNKIAIKVES